MRARRIIDDVLSEDPDNVRALMDHGFVFQYAKQWDDAGRSFAKVVDLLPDNLNDGLRAKEELSWTKAQVADPDCGVKGLKEVLSVLDSLEGRDIDQARCWWRLGQCYWVLEGTTLTDDQGIFVSDAGCLTIESLLQMLKVARKPTGVS
jgi:superkiller protein 3